MLHSAVTHRRKSVRTNGERAATEYGVWKQRKGKFAIMEVDDVGKLLAPRHRRLEPGAAARHQPVDLRRRPEQLLGLELLLLLRGAHHYVRAPFRRALRCRHHHAAALQRGQILRASCLGALCLARRSISASPLRTASAPANERAGRPSSRRSSASSFSSTSFAKRGLQRTMSPPCLLR